MAENLTEKQADFVRHIISGSLPINACKLAGYAGAETQAYNLIRLPHVQNAIVKGMQTKLLGQGVPLALRVLFDVLDDPEMNAKLKVDVAKYIIDKAEAISKMNSLDDLIDKNPMEMTEAELQLFVMKGRVILRNAQEEAKLKDLGIIENNSA